MFARYALVRACLISILLCVGSSAIHADSPTTFRLMSFNILHGGTKLGQPLSQTSRVMKLADVVGIQETHEDQIDRSVEIARILGWHHFQQGNNTAVVSRFPIVGHTPRNWGVFIQLDTDLKICVINAHFPASPYQPYQLLNIPYGDDVPFIKTADEAIQWADRSRGAPLRRMMRELVSVRDQRIPVFVTGDFNEPSHQDWTDRTASAGTHPIAVEYPTTKTVVSAGLVDAYRQYRSDELEHPGFTWTPLTKNENPDDHHDRIDFIFADQRCASIESCEVVGETEFNADKVIDPWPSDHRAVLATIAITRQFD